MKIKVELEKGETVEAADEFLAKALAAKTECEHGERYSDDAINEAHDHICKLFNSLTTDLHLTIKDIVEDATRTKNPGQN